MEGKANDLYDSYLSFVRPIIKKAAALGSEILLDTTSLENMTADYKQQQINKQKKTKQLALAKRQYNKRVYSKTFLRVKSHMI